MPTRILIPTPLRVYADKQDVVEAEGATVGELLANMTARYSDLRKHLYNEEGKLRSFVAIYLNDDDIRFLDREATPVKDGDTVSIIPSVAGGRLKEATPVKDGDTVSIIPSVAGGVRP